VLELPEGAAAGVLEGALGAGALELDEEPELESDDDDEDEESEELELEPEDESDELELSDFADPLAVDALLVLSRESLR
jgi:hypothetical protein